VTVLPLFTLFDNPTVVAARITALASVTILYDRREAEGNAVTQTATTVGLSKRVKRGRTVTNPMENYVAFMMQQREESRREERLAREASERCKKSPSSMY